MRNLPLRIRRIAVIVFWFTCIPEPDLFIPGLVAMGLGSIIIILSYSVLLKRDEISQDGPFAFCRHPSYFGMLVSALGFCFASGWHVHSIILSVAFIVISVPLYYRKIAFEEQRLVELHGEKYLEYRRRVRRKLVPSIISGIRNGGFRIRLSFEASIRNHSLKRVSKDCFWFLFFVAKWYYFEGLYPFGDLRWTGRGHSWLLSGGLAALLAFFLVFKYLDHRYRLKKDTSNN